MLEVVSVGENLRPAAFHNQPSRFTRVAAFCVRVRNDLPRAIQSLRVDASYYNAAGKLIRVETLWLEPEDAHDGRVTVVPGATSDFRGMCGTYDLPLDATYRLELVEAHYVP